MSRRFISKSVIGKVTRIMTGIFILVAACVLLLAGALLAGSPGKVGTFLDGKGNVLEGSISEKTSVVINGVKQGMIIKGRKSTNPVLLFLHGGPGMPEYFLTENYHSTLEDSFTVCYWEQRGAGLSYNPGMLPGPITEDQLVSDTIAVTDYLRERFGSDKIYLLGRSWGSFIGIQAAAKAPEKYHAYIGIGQISQQLDSERLAYDYMLMQYKNAGNKKMVQKLEKYPIHTSEAAFNAYLSSPLRDEAMHGIGVGTMHDMKSVITGVFLPVMQCRSYTFSEKINIWRGKAFLRKSTNLHRSMYSTDLAVKVPQLDIPTYFLSGIYDYTVNCKLSKEYLNGLRAPVKGFYTFEKSAHSPHFEEPELFMRVMLEDVVRSKTDLADGTEGK